MTILINTNESVEGNESANAYFSKEIAKDLSRFEKDITRIEVHLADQNGNKNGVQDKTCTMEARLAHHSSLAVTSNGDTVAKAIGCHQQNEIFANLYFGQTA
ncbi:MAG: hypothetical protein RLZZ337_1928 [Bacteroidota bacterium]|jgi:hypothetical protein